MDTSMGTPEDDNDPDGILEGQMAAWLADKAHRRRLLEDFPYFCEHALKLRAESGELIPLIFNHSQRHLWAAIEKQWKETGRIRVVICKARQQGASTLTAALFYWLAIRKRGQRGYIIAHRQQSVSDLFGNRCGLRQ